MPMFGSSERLNHLLAHKTAIYDAGVIMDGDPAEFFKNYFHRNALNFLNPIQRLRKTGIPPPPPDLTSIT